MLLRIVVAERNISNLGFGASGRKCRWRSIRLPRYGTEGCPQLPEKEKRDASEERAVKAPLLTTTPRTRRGRGLPCGM